MKYLLFAIIVVVILLPIWVFLTSREGLIMLQADPQNLALSLFPLFGLLAFTLVWLQVMLGTFMRKLIRFYPGIYKFHRTEGIFALTFSFLHPLLLLFGFGNGFFTFEFVSPEQIIFVLLGYTALILMVTTVLTAIFYRRSFLLRNWRKIHLLNYLILPLVFFHSKNLGSDVQSPPLSGLWWFYLVTFLGALGYKLLVKKGTPSIQRPSETNLTAQPPTS